MNGEGRLAARDCLDKEGEEKKTENAWIKRRGGERESLASKDSAVGEFWREVIRGIKPTLPHWVGGWSRQAVRGAAVSQTV